MPLVHPVAELEKLSEASTTPLARAMSELARSVVDGDVRAQDSARARLAVLMRQTLRYAILLGRRRVLLEADAATAKASREDRRRQLLENCSATRLLESGLGISPFATSNEGAKPGKRLEFAAPLQMPKTAFDEAIADLLGREPRLAFGYEAVQILYADQHAFALAKSIDIEVTKRVQQAMTTMLRQGTTLESAQDVIGQLGRWTRSYADTVYRTNVATAYSAGRFVQAADPDVEDVFKAFEFVTAGDVDVRHNHEAGHGSIASTRDPIWDRMAPPLGYNSFLPGTRVSGRVVGASRAPYRGPVVHVQTGNGRRLSVTVNHPVLTASGWKPAGLLREGDHLLCYGGQVEALGLRDPRVAALVAPGRRAVHDEHVMPAIEDVYDALRARRDLVQSVLPGVTALDFHGDATSFYRDVDVVRPDRELFRHVETATEQFLGELVLPTAWRPSASGDRTGLLLARPPVLCSFGPAADAHAFADETARQHATADPEFARQAQQALAGGVLLDSVTNVDHDSYSGHVYDLQTEGGWLLASTIVTSNCRCQLELVDVWELEQRGLIRQGQVVRSLNGGALWYPDPGFGGGRPDRRLAGLAA